VSLVNERMPAEAAEAAAATGATGAPRGAAAVAAARAVAAVAAEHAAAVDRDAAFPAAAVDRLRAERLLAAAVPARFGGAGCDLPSLVRIAGVLAGGCGSTAMVWAMHQLQVACLARHCGAEPVLVDLLARIGAGQLLVASVTSERGVGGNIRASQAAVLGTGPDRTLDKQATTVSYGQQADAFLVTARRGPDADAGDQVAVLALRAQVRLDRTGGWNPMGMRGTDSPAMRVRATVPAGQILPTPFADVAAETMVPLSHLLWSAVWTGLATAAYERARRMVRARHRPGTAPDPRLARADEVLSGLEARLTAETVHFGQCYAGDRAPTVRDLTRSNALKLAASTESVRVAELALETCGMAGYQEDGDYSVARILRDLYSARLMVSNDRLTAANAAALMTVRRD
jgi:acyl-CoA dehydrogenase